VTFATITLTGKFQDVAQNWLGGTITIVPNFSEAIDATASEIFAAIPQAYAIHPSSAGFTTDPLVTTDSTDLVPGGWQYDVTVAVTGLPSWTFALLLPSSLGSTADLSQLSPVVPAPPQRQAIGGFNVVPSGATSGTVDYPNIANALAGSGYASLSPGTYYIDQTVTVDTQQVFAGFGDGVIIRPAAGFTGSYMVTLATPASSTRATIRDLTLSIDWALNASSGTIGGVQIDNTGWTSPGGSLELPDPLHVLQDILVIRASGDGYHFDHNAREMRCENLRSYDALGYSFYLGDSGGSGSGCTDSHFSDCTGAQSALNCWEILDANNHFTNCKGFGAGNNVQTSTWGTTEYNWHLNGSHCVNNVFAGCSGQQAALHNWFLDGCAQCSVGICDADSAGSGAGAGYGMLISGATSCVVFGLVGEQSITPGNQTYGIAAQGINTGTYIMFNPCKGVDGTFHFISGQGYYLIDGPSITDFSSMNEVRFGSLGLYEGTPFVIASGNTIVFAPGVGTYVCDPAGNVDLIELSPLEAGMGPGQMMNILNISAYTMTFAASGTSNVAGGTSVVIPASSAAMFTWDTNTSLWYPVVSA
jgi:hypothetical protein